MICTAVTYQKLSDGQRMLLAAESAVPAQLAEANEHTPSAELSQGGLAESRHEPHEWHTHAPLC